MSLVLLQSEKLITPKIKDGSDEPDNFVNIFKQPIKIQPNQTIELVSFGFNKNASILINSTNNVFYYRIGNFDNFLTHKVVIPIGNYTQSRFLTALEEALEKSTNLNQFNFAVSYDNNTEKVKIAITQSLPSTDLNQSSVDFGDVFPTDSGNFSSTFTESQVGNDYLYTSNISKALTNSSITNNPEKLSLICSSGTPLFSNGGKASMILKTQRIITNFDTASAISNADVVFSKTGQTDSTLSTSSNWSFQANINGSVAYFHVLTGYTNSIKDNSNNEVPWYDRNKFWIMSSNSSFNLPSTIDNTTITGDSSLLMYKISDNIEQSGDDLTGSITEMTKVYGGSLTLDGYSITNIKKYLTFQNKGYQSGSVGINSYMRVPPNSTQENVKLMNDDSIMNSDYSVGIETTTNANGTISVKLKGNRTKSKNHTLISNVILRANSVDYSDGIDLGSVGSIKVNGGNDGNSHYTMDELKIELSLSTGAGASGQVKFNVYSRSHNFTTDTIGSWTLNTDCSGVFKDIQSKFKEDFYPLYAVYGLSSGAYGQNMRSNNAYELGGVFSNKTHTLKTTHQLESLNLLRADYEDIEEIGSNFLGASKQTLTYFFRFDEVNDVNINTSNSAGSDYNEIDLRDVESTGTRNATSNDASVGDVMNYDTFYRENASEFDVISNSGEINTDYVAENINILLPDFNIKGFNGVNGMPQKIIASIPAEQIETDQSTGRLYHQSKIPNRIKLHNKNEEEINHIRVQLTTPEGKSIPNLNHPTTLLIKINE